MHRHLEMLREAWPEVTNNELLTISLLWARGPLGATAVGTALGLSPAGTSAMTARLEKRGLVVRREDVDDARRTVISLTSAGRRPLLCAP